MSVAIVPVVLVGVVGLGLAGGARPQPSPASSPRPAEPSAPSTAGALDMSWIVFDDATGMVLAAGPQG